MTHYTHEGYIVCEKCDATGKEPEGDYTCRHCNGTGHRLPHTTDLVLLLLAVLDKLEKAEKRAGRSLNG